MDPFNPFEHFDDLVCSNVDGGVIFGMPWRPIVTLPSGQPIPSAVPNHPDTITYWLDGADGVYHQITPAQAFVQEVWLHAMFGASLLTSPVPALDAQGLNPAQHFTVAEFTAGVMSMPKVLQTIEDAHLSAAQVLAYVEAEAPGVVLVGQP
jgi:hypothetical protein